MKSDLEYIRDAAKYKHKHAHHNAEKAQLSLIIGVVNQAIRFQRSDEEVEVEHDAQILNDVMMSHFGL